MGRINLANIKKTIYYLKRNGIKNTCYAVKERLAEGKVTPYSYAAVSEAELESQRKWSADKKVTFSIIVPTYRTNEIYLREMIQSVADQTYPCWELVLADATEDDSVKNAVDKITAKAVDNRVKQGVIRYIKLPENAGIAANTNQALQYATGDYIGLLDHDDVLTPDALYEMAVRILEAKKSGTELQMLYSDEDKCNEDRTNYYELNRKEEFNLDLLLSNNYICHFLVMKSELIKELGFRSAYDGAQDYDLVLRAAGKTAAIAYVPKVLYHWRCHSGSTAENPQSKQYAYDAGLQALQDFADSMNYQAKAVHLKHLGFYMLEYPQGILQSRKDLGAVGGRILGMYNSDNIAATENGCVATVEKSSVGNVMNNKNDGPTAVIGRKKPDFGGLRLIGGRMTVEGDVYYEGLPAHYSGYLHRAVLTQTAEAVDIRCIQIKEECRELFEKITGVKYVEVPSGAETNPMIFDASTLPAGTDYKALSLTLCKAMQEAGYGILYHPSLEVIWKGEQR